MTSDSEEKRNARHKAAMEKQKESVDASIAAASEERGVTVLVTGNGKAKSSSAFGMVIRALGYGHKVGVVQFIKGAQLSRWALVSPGIRRTVVLTLPRLKEPGKSLPICWPTPATILWCSMS